MIEYMDILFDWDENKAKINEKKHGITFLEAMTVFKDTCAVMLDDDEHSEEEERFVLLGVSKEKNLLMVCHCYRENDEIIRLISARKANTQESKIYVGGKKQ